MARDPGAGGQVLRPALPEGKRRKLGGRPAGRDRYPIRDHRPGVRLALRGAGAGDQQQGDSGWSPSTTGYPATVYDIDGIYIYWTDRQGSEKLHDDVADLGSNTLENACDTGESFRAFWLQPLESRDADEWEADVHTIDGTGTAQYTLRTAPELTGAVALDGFTVIAIRIRGRFGEDWSNWSRAVNLICVPTEDDSGSATGNSSTGSENATNNPLAGFELVDATAHLDAGAVDDGMTLTLTHIDPDQVYGFRANLATSESRSPLPLRQNHRQNTESHRANEPMRQRKVTAITNNKTRSCLA